jgi:hypothetical protein
VSAQFFITAPLPPEPVAPKITTSASKHYSCTFNISKAKRGIGRDPWGAPNIHCFSTATCRAPTSQQHQILPPPICFLRSTHASCHCHSCRCGRQAYENLRQRSTVLAKWPTPVIQQHSPSAPFTALRPLPQTARGPYIIHSRYPLPHLAPNAQTALTRPQVSTNTTYGPTLTHSSCWFPYYNLTLFGAYNLTFDYRYLSYSKPRHPSTIHRSLPSGLSRSQFSSTLHIPSIARAEQRPRLPPGLGSVTSIARQIILSIFL